MAKTAKCRVCGKEYEPCHTAMNGDGIFRWREVACSPECGEIYLDRIRKSRMKNVENDNNSETKESPKTVESKSDEVVHSRKSKRSTH